MNEATSEIFANVFEHLHIGVKVWKLENPNDPASLRLVASNPAAAVATGVKRDLVLGKTIAEGFPQAVPDGIAARFAEVALSGQPQDMGELVYSDPRVREGVFSIYAFPLPDRCVAVAFENITRRKWEMAAIERKATFMHLLQQVAVAANEAATSDDAFQQCIDDVCEHTRWPVGHVYRRADDPAQGLVPTNLWHLDDAERFARFRDQTAQTELGLGIGLPGRVLESGKAEWIIDVHRDDRFPRSQVVEDLGVRAGFAFPVLTGKEVAAVLEFYAIESRIPDHLLLDVMEQIGIQLGRVIERERAWSMANPR